MNEKPLEWMNVCGESTGHRMGRVAALAGIVVLFLFYLMTGKLFSLVGMAGFGVLYWWLQRHAYVEYEFNYFSDDMDISVIYNRARRKRKLKFTLADVEYIVKKVEPQEVTKYFCNKSNQGSIYTMVVNVNSKRTAIVFEPKPEFLKVLEMKRKVR